MAYRFTLAAVLKLRESIEERDLHLLELTQHEIAHKLRLLEITQEQEQAEIATRERELSAGTYAALVDVVEAVQRRLRERQREMEKSLAELQLRRQKQLATYESSRRDRQVLSELRDRQREEYDARAARHEQRVADDMFLARHRNR